MVIFTFSFTRFFNFWLYRNYTLITRYFSFLNWTWNFFLWIFFRIQNWSMCIIYLKITHQFYLNEFQINICKVISTYESKLNADKLTRVPTAGEVLSSHPKVVDKRRKDTRKKRSAEPNQTKVIVSKKHKRHKSVNNLLYVKYKIKW